MRIASWNINSVRPRIDLVTDWMRTNEPDVLLLQETKCVDAAFPAFDGYESAHFGRNHYNGVAVLSRLGLADVQFGFRGVVRPPFDEPRLISATCGGVRCVNIYAPNGRQAGDDHWIFKLVWLERLRGELASDGIGSMPAVLAGDLNIAPGDLDLYDPARWRNKNHATRQERDALQSLLDLGLCDIVRERHPQGGLYTWWNYQPHMLEANRGMRIDLALVSEPLSERVGAAWIDVEVRRKVPTSDHAPVVIDLE